MKHSKAFSPDTIARHSRLRGATASVSVCPYCAVGCSQLVYSKRGQVIDIEGNPQSPINQGTLCPKGANTFQLVVEPPSRHARQIPCAVQRPLGGAAARLGDGSDRAAGQGSARRRFYRARRAAALRSTISRASRTLAAQRSTTRKTTSSRNCSAAGSEFYRSKTRPGYDTAPRCPVWAPPSDAARRPRFRVTSPTAIAS